MSNDYESIGSYLYCLVGIGIIVLLVMALVYLVKKTKQEEVAAKLELQQLVTALPPQSQAAFLVQYNVQRKDPTTAVVLALLFGGIGLHKFYLGQTGLGILYLLFSWTFVPAIVSFFEAFALTRSVIQKNREFARETAAMLGGSSITPAGLV
ncbi:MAG TPA: TM2 domain-containing protein [Anaerolineae bacterium]|nr:TM2 domain-containing protein [Anaerolineae bacterium]HQJ51335.1 TM2 domain-containing protein [Anaerolineae bacterium]